MLPGPTGYRVKVVDYDASTNRLYQALELKSGLVDESDPYKSLPDDELLSDPRFHAQNCYAIVMRILARFEFALGRRLPWGCAGHQLHLSPHAFAEPNAFYSRDDRGLFFGYFRMPGDTHGSTVFTCLSHDIVAHETTHALLDGLRSSFMEPSLADQGAFHEGFADIVALLSIFALPETVGLLLGAKTGDKLIDVRKLKAKSLRLSALLGLAKEMGQALSGRRYDALRRSILLPQGHDYLNDPEFAEEHRRGEILVAAMLSSFLQIWEARLEKIGTIVRGKKDLSLVVDEGARAADHLLTMAIRAIDYCPPVNLAFSDYLSALLTVDREVVPDDRYGYRKALMANFAAYGISASPNADADGTWRRCGEGYAYSRTHFDSMLRDEEEVFRFVWENRGPLELDEIGYAEVQSVRPSIRIAPDGFVVRETIAEYTQRLTATAEELRTIYKIPISPAIPDWKAIPIMGGGTLIFDEYGRLKYQIGHHLANSEEDKAWQARRVDLLWSSGRLDEAPDTQGRFAMLHMARMSRTPELVRPRVKSPRPVAEGAAE